MRSSITHHLSPTLVLLLTPDLFQNRLLVLSALDIAMASDPELDFEKKRYCM